MTTDREIGSYTINGLRIPLIERTPSIRDVMYGMPQHKLDALAATGNFDAVAEVLRRAQS